jgi:hypothetical protein
VFPAGLGQWTLDELGSATRKDPVNVIWFGRDSTATGDVLRLLTFPYARLGPIHVSTRLDTTQFGGDQWFAHDIVATHRHDLSLGTFREIWPAGGRLHIRAYEPGPPDPRLGRYTASAVHQDALGLAKPPDVAIAFNEPREALAVALWALRIRRRRVVHVDWVRLRDRRSARQGDGRTVFTDGWVLLVR